MEQCSELIKRLDTMNGSELILLCFPYAGGGASVYYPWEKSMPDGTRVCPIHLPGREERILEKSYTDLAAVIEDVMNILGNYNNDIVLYGHSMGAKIAYEVGKRLEAEGKSVKLLIVSGSRPPHIAEPNPICYLEDHEFKRELARFEGTPKEILECEEILDFFLPMLRADFTMDELYKPKNRIRMRCPVLALGGEEDTEADAHEIAAWEEYASDSFEYCIFPGGHFFLKSSEKEMLSFICSKIMECS